MLANINCLQARDLVDKHEKDTLPQALEELAAKGRWPKKTAEILHIKKKGGAFLVRASVDVEHWYVLHTSSISSQFLVMIARVILSLCSNFGISSAANYGARHLSYFWCSKAMQPWVAKPLKG